jgi:hypothetical protein
LTRAAPAVAAIHESCRRDSRRLHPRFVNPAITAAQGCHRELQ